MAGVDVKRSLQILAAAKAISLEDAPKGYAEFDKGIAAKFVLDPHDMLVPRR
jgi:glutathione-independent formaldehyde dehydrogenase